MKILTLTALNGTPVTIVFSDAEVTPVPVLPPVAPFDEDVARQGGKERVAQLNSQWATLTFDLVDANTEAKIIRDHIADEQTRWRDEYSKASARAAIHIYSGESRSYVVRETVDEISRMLAATPAPTASPTEADIARRVALVHEACVVTHEPVAFDAGYMGVARQIDSSGANTRYWKRVGEKWATQQTHYEQAIRAIAIKGLLSERGAR